MTYLPGESAHQTYPATPEEVKALGRQTESLIRSYGKPLKFAPHILRLEGHDISQELIPEEARPFLQLTLGGLVDFKATKNLETGQTVIQLRQLAVPREYPVCVFKNSVTYDLTDGGRRTAEAVITNTNALCTVVNPDHPSGETPFLVQTEVEQLAQLLSSSSLQRAIGVES
jgi:hypothetical protein